MLTLFSGRHFMHVRRAFALAAAAPLLLAGCTDQPEPMPKIPDPPTSSSTPSPSESETAEAESAQNFIRRWASVEAEMENTGDTAEYLELSRGCRACAKLAKLVEGYYASGGYVKWQGWEIINVRPHGNSGRAFSVRVDSAPTSYVEKAGGPSKSFPGGPGQHLLTLDPVDSSWVVVDKSEVGG